MILRLGMLAISIAITGCVLSISDSFPAAQAIFDQRLLGDWTEVDGSDHVTVARDGDVYLIDHFDGDGSVMHLRGRLGRIASRFVLDITPIAEQSEEEAAMFVPTHLLLSIDFSGDNLSVGALEPDTLRQRLASGRATFAHILRENDVLLTDSPAELPANLVRYLAQPGVWAEPSLWRRTPPAGKS